VVRRYLEQGVQLLPHTLPLVGVGNALALDAKDGEPVEQLARRYFDGLLEAAEAEEGDAEVAMDVEPARLEGQAALQVLHGLGWLALV
jgi:hypothetical protein